MIFNVGGIISNFEVLLASFIKSYITWTFLLTYLAEYSLEEYSTLKGMKKKKKNGKTKIMAHLIGSSIYKEHLKKSIDRYKIRGQDINACSRVLYHELSKHAHGSTKELEVRDTEHSITEVTAIETGSRLWKNTDAFPRDSNFS